MNKKQLISVVVPCYNQAQYLDECLQSVLDQTYKDWECIIVNDGSPDNTEEVAQKWTQKDRRFKYLKKENGGLSSARNAGIEIAQGEWILPLDSDDKIGSQYLELAEEEFEKGYKVIYCNAEYFGDKQGKWILPDFSLKNLSQDNCIFCSALYPKKLWEEHGGYDENMKTALEDWEFWIRIIKNVNAVLKLDYTGFYYRIKSQSMINGVRFETKEPVIKYIEKKHIDFFQKYCGTYHQLIFEKSLAEKREKQLLSILNSRRYKMVDLFLKRIGR